MKKVEVNTGGNMSKTTEYMLRVAALLLSVFVVFSVSRSTVVDLVNKSLQIRDLSGRLRSCQVQLVKVNTKQLESPKKEVDAK